MLPFLLGFPVFILWQKKMAWALKKTNLYLLACMCTLCYCQCQCPYMVNSVPSLSVVKSLCMFTLGSFLFCIMLRNKHLLSSKKKEELKKGERMVHLLCLQVNLQVPKERELQSFKQQQKTKNIGMCHLHIEAWETAIHTPCLMFANTLQDIFR